MLEADGEMFLEVVEGRGREVGGFRELVGLVLVD